MDAFVVTFFLATIFDFGLRAGPEFRQAKKGLELADVIAQPEPFEGAPW